MRFTENVIIRADAGKTIGIGHIMRCLSLAEAMRDQEVHCVFVASNEVPKTMVRERGFDFITLNHEKTSFVSGELDGLLEEYSPRFVVLDSYLPTPEYFKNLQKLSPLVYFDDIKAFPYPCDILVNYNIYGMDWQQEYTRQQLPFGSKLILGPQYAPLRKEFYDLSCRNLEVPVQKILVSTGGADPQNVAWTVLNLVKRVRNWESIEFHLVIGELNAHKAEIELLASNMPNIVLHLHTKNISRLMRECDAAISAAGSTLYELCACGIPTITYVLADNQIPGAHSFEKHGVMLYAGDCRKMEKFVHGLREKVDLLIHQDALRKNMSKAARDLVDGKGAYRLAKTLMEMT